MKYSFILITTSIISFSLQNELEYTRTANKCKNEGNIYYCDRSSNITAGIICCTQTTNLVQCVPQASIFGFLMMLMYKNYDQVGSLQCWDHYPNQDMYDIGIKCLNITTPKQANDCNSISSNNISCCHSTSVENGIVNPSSCVPIYSNLTKYFLNNNFLNNLTQNLSLNCGGSASYTLPTSNSYYGNNYVINSGQLTNNSGSQNNSYSTIIAFGFTLNLLRILLLF